MTVASISVPAAAKRGCIAIGNFDGVHRGHTAMLNRLRQIADQCHSPAIAVTFDPHPIAVLRPEFTPPLLTTLPERTRLLESAGADHVVVLPVTGSLLEMTARDFFEEIVIRQFEACGIVEGPNFRFGRDRHGNAELLASWCLQRHLVCEIAESVSNGDEMISSSRIRELLCARALRNAVELLGHPYRMTGVVRRGAGRGRTIGFPTANLTDIATLLPSHGVYAGRTSVQGKAHAVAVSIGPNPTFGEHREKVECHIADFTGDLYDSTLNVDLLSEVRPLQSFSSADNLIQQIRLDLQTVRDIVSRNSFTEDSGRR